MDNLTHSLIGALAGEAAARFIPTVKSTLPESARRTLFLGLMVVGSNVPDLDLFYTGIAGGKLGYLLQHRGHTHTVVGAMVAAALMYLVCITWVKWRNLSAAPMDRCWLALLALFAPLLHIAMDAANSYGVHPFWPFNNDWLYGDSIFIVEPLFWVAAGTPLLFLLRTRLARAVVALILLTGIVLSFGTGLVPRPLAVGLAGLMAGLLLVGWLTSARTVVLSGLAVTVGVFCMFVTASHLASRKLEALVAGQFPHEKLLDHVLTPMPVNPVCWEVIVIQVLQDKYTLRRANLSLAPNWIVADTCPLNNMTADITAPLTPVAAPGSAALQWYGEVVMSVAEVRSVSRQSCEAAAFTRFARALFVSRREDGWLIGDLRFDHEPGLGLAELALDSGHDNCPPFIPPWTPPRSDILQ